MSGKTLADEDVEDVDDTQAWIARSRKRQEEMKRMEAEERKREGAEAAKKVSIHVYSERDLSGMTVAHDVEDLAEDGEHILILKDQSVLDGDGDELMSVAMTEKEKSKQFQDAKSRKKAYQAFEDAPDTNVLSQYDDEVLGPQKKVQRMLFLVSIRILGIRNSRCLESPLISRMCNPRSPKMTGRLFPWMIMP